MSTMRCCSTWNVPSATPNCLRVLLYSSVDEFSSVIAPTASAHSAAMARSRHASSAATPSPSVPSNWLAGTCTFISVDFGGAPAVDRPEALQVKIGRMAVDHKEADPVAIARAARCPRRDDQFVGPRRSDHRRLGAAQNVAFTLTPRGRVDIAEIVARACLRPAQRPDRFAGHDLRQIRFALRRRAGVLDQAACEHHGLEERFDHQVAAELLHHDHRRQRSAAKAAGTFLERRSTQAEFGKGIPVLAAKAFVGRDDLAARVEIVLIPQQSLNAASKQFLFFRQLNVHRTPRSLPLKTQHRFRDDVALDLVRPAVDAELA